ncbi:MAG TPA: SDR family oxidoreductase [Candidatus Limnocylindrales bacterium]|nr:SDR family oxidoreductase [Candidatus Limnocylindrales bacterium]
MRLKDQITLITGGGRGIGKALALAFAREGSHVILVARTESEILATASEVQQQGRKALPLKVDVSREEEVREMMQKSMETFGRIDTLINNAGVLTPRVPLVEVSTQDWNLTLDVNLKGTFLCCREVLPIMMKQRTGSIINLSSGVVHRVATHWGPYAISKVAVEYLTKVLAEEVRAYGIRVNSVNPGKAATRMRALAYPEEDPTTLPKPEDITEVFVYLASPEAKEVTGQSLDARQWKPSH